MTVLQIVWGVLVLTTLFSYLRTEHPVIAVMLVVNVVFLAWMTKRNLHG